MKKTVLILSLFSMMALASCHRTSCPTYDNSSGEFKIKDGKKTKSGVLPP